MTSPFSRLFAGLPVLPLLAGRAEYPLHSVMTLEQGNRLCRQSSVECIRAQRLPVRGGNCRIESRLLQLQRVVAAHLGKFILVAGIGRAVDGDFITLGKCQDLA